MPLHTRAAALVGVAVLTSGCYTYRDVSTSAPLPHDTMVRVELTDAGTTHVTPTIGASVLYVEGALQRSSAEGVTLRVTALRRRGEPDARWTGDLLQLSKEDVRYLSERKLSRGRSIAAGASFGALGVGLLYAIAKATGLVSGSPSRPPVPPTT
ncbi:MAG TPA: hypothetical protein VFV33_24620 [Gemmatimonadaceae bacterium]|nr:hypothetical protein [Gemmatimonadaceae bacterium]